jgi:hypothetical protein
MYIGKIVLGESFTLEHLTQFMGLCSAIQDVHIDESIEDRISWKLTEIGNIRQSRCMRYNLLGGRIHFIQDGVEGLGLLMN